MHLHVVLMKCFHLLLLQVNICFIFMKLKNHIILKLIMHMHFYFLLKKKEKMI